MADLVGIDEKPAAAVPLAQRRATLTRARILDAAEYLFGHASPDTVSLRDISGRAQVALGLVHHHFLSKEALIEHVLVRRAQDLCTIRQARLAAFDHRTPTLEEVVDAFFGPLFERLRDDEDDGWHAYVKLLAQVAFTDRWRDLRPRHFEPTLELYYNALTRALPGITPEQLRYGFNLALMCMIHVITEGSNLDDAVHGDSKRPGAAGAYPYLLRFSCAGMRGMVQA